jgi:hypothetical protein
LFIIFATSEAETGDVKKTKLSIMVILKATKKDENNKQEPIAKNVNPKNSGIAEKCSIFSPSFNLKKITTPKR